MMRRSVRKRASFELDKVAPLDVVDTSYIAALFGAHLNNTPVVVSMLAPPGQCCQMSEMYSCT